MWRTICAVGLLVLVAGPAYSQGRPRPLRDLSLEVTDQAGDLRTQNAHYRLKSARMLGRVAGAVKTYVIVLAGCLKRDPEADVRAEAAWALGQIGPSAKDAVPALAGALKDMDERVRRRAAFALGLMGPFGKQAVPALITALDDPGHGNPVPPYEDSVRVAALKALGRIGPDAKAAAAALRKISETGVAADRQDAFIALAKISPTDRSLVPLFIKALKDKDLLPGAAFALGELGPTAKEAVPDLLKALKDHPLAATPAAKQIRMSFVWALGYIGPDAKQAVPVLRELVSGPDPWLAQTAKMALEKITGTANETP